MPEYQLDWIKIVDFFIIECKDYLAAPGMYYTIQGEHLAKQSKTKMVQNTYAKFHSTQITFNP